MKIAICDDNPQDLRQISELLQRYDPKIAVDVFSSAKELYLAVQSAHYDAVILDIEMESPNGYEIALRLAQEDTHPIIIFATNSADYAVRGYGLALRYLLKPLKLKNIAEALDAVRKEISGSRLFVTLDGTAHALHVQDVYYAEVSGHQTTLHTANGAFTSRDSLRDLADQLPSRYFCAPHQSFLVNLLHVRSVGADTVVLTNGVTIPCSRRKQKEFLLRFYQFLGV